VTTAPLSRRSRRPDWRSRRSPGQTSPAHGTHELSAGDAPPPMIATGYTILEECWPSPRRCNHPGDTAAGLAMTSSRWSTTG
jgi:hypothetical protein